MAKNSFNYIGQAPVQTPSDNSGIFDTNEVINLLDRNEYPGKLEVQSLVVAGGGGGGAEYAGGGGGAGGYRSSYTGDTYTGQLQPRESSSFVFVGATFTVTVGAGGARALVSGPSLASNGNDSVFNTVTSIGGGAGCAYNVSPAGSGGSGGGNYGTPGQGTAGQGFAGSGKQWGGSNDVGGGGGGASEAGNTDGHGQGGDGQTSLITGSSVTRAGGGGGGSDAGGTQAGGGGTGGGGNPGVYGQGGNGADNFGGGGGGGSSGPNGNQNGGNGGKGVVILRYSNEFNINYGVGLTGSTALSGNDKITTFTNGSDTGVYFSAV